MLASPGVIPVVIYNEYGIPDSFTGLGLTTGMRGLLAPGVSIPVAIPVAINLKSCGQKNLVNTY